MNNPVWQSEDGVYQVRFSREVAGVPVRPHFHAMFRSEAGSLLFAGRRGPYYSESQAIKACNRHARFWKRYDRLKLKKRRAGKKAQLQELLLRAKVGKGVTLNFILNIPPDRTK